MNIEIFKKISRNRQVNFVHKEFENYLKTTILNAQALYFNISESVEDMYWVFMYEVPKIIEEFSGTTRNELLIFLGLKCKFFTLNRCKKLIGKSFSVLNHALPLSEEILNGDYEDSRLSDYVTLSSTFDLTIFDELELEVFRLMFVEDLDIIAIAKKLGISRYIVDKTLDSIKKKYEKSIK